MNKEAVGRVNDITGATTAADGYWRVVKVDLEDGEEYKDDKLFGTSEEAMAYCDARQRKWEKDADDIWEYRSMEYQVRFVTQEELAEEKRQKLEEWHTFLRKTYLDPLVPATFKSCCQRLVLEMLKKVERQTEKELSNMRHDGKSLYSPWQAYGGTAKLWTYMQLESGSSAVSYWGMFTQRSMAGALCHRIAVFDDIEDFKAWLKDTNQAVEVLEKKMLEALNNSIHSDEILH